jgi:hypothetical protein
VGGRSTFYTKQGGRGASQPCVNPTRLTSPHAWKSSHLLEIITILSLLLIEILKISPDSCTVIRALVNVSDLNDIFVKSINKSNTVSKVY